MTRIVLFKDMRLSTIKMLKVTLYVQRKRGGEENDDIIKIYEDPDFSDMCRVTYTTPELEKTNQFYMTRHLVSRYISDLLSAFVHDNDPFEYIQVTTAIHPSVNYHMSELDNSRVRYLIEDMVYDAIKTPVVRVN